MRRASVLDDIDKEILRTISIHPKISQVELAEKVGLTQPAISLRLRKLRRLNVLNDANAIIDPHILGIKMLHINIHMKNNAKIVEKARRCPMITNCYTMAGNNVSLVVIGESKQFLNCMLHRHIEMDSTETDTSNIIESIKGINASVDLDQRLEKLPCGDPPCTECEYYVDNGGECVGCPLTVYYKGTLWKR